MDFKDKNPAPNGILEVRVQAGLANPGISPQTITLTNQVHTVRWRCVNLPRGARLEIHFPADLRGPFVDLWSTDANPREVAGFGNRGPQDTLPEYEYEARIVRRRGLKRVVATGRLINHATHHINDPRAGGLGDPPPADPVGGAAKN
jgi:hypothetical protein